MPKVEQRLLAQYFLSHVNMKPNIAYSESSENYYIQFIFENEEEASTAYVGANKLFSSIAENILVETPVNTVDYIVNIPIALLTIKLSQDLKNIALMILSKASKEYLYPHDYQDDPHFCEIIKNTFVIPSIHQNIVGEISKMFAMCGIQLNDMNYEWARLFRKSEYQLKEILLSPDTIDAAKLVTALKKFVKAPATETSLHTEPMGLPPLPKRPKAAAGAKKPSRP